MDVYSLLVYLAEHTTTNYRWILCGENFFSDEICQLLAILWTSHYIILTDAVKICLIPNNTFSLPSTIPLPFHPIALSFAIDVLNVNALRCGENCRTVEYWIVIFGHKWMLMVPWTRWLGVWFHTIIYLYHSLQYFTGKPNLFDWIAFIPGHRNARTIRWTHCAH